MATDPNTLRPRYRLSAADYLRMCETGIIDERTRVELIDGELLALEPVGARHSTAVARCNGALGRAMNRRTITWVQSPIRTDDFSQPRPDLAILELRGDFYAKAHPTAEDVLLLIEVGEETLAYKRDVKIPHYAAAGIQEVWLIDLGRARINRYAEPTPTGFARHDQPDRLDRLAPKALPGTPVDLSGLFGQRFGA